MNDLERILRRRSKVKSVTKYQIKNDYSVTAYDTEDNETHGNDLEQMIVNAKKLTQEDGQTRYITQVIQVVKPVKQPYEVTLEEYK